MDVADAYAKAIPAATRMTVRRFSFKKEVFMERSFAAIFCVYKIWGQGDSDGI
jgi:hypothetical protein